jgi:hemolysin III
MGRGVFMATSVLLFGNSALYHRFNWKPRTKSVLKRIDHANILLLIAGTYTPLAVLALPPGKGTLLLIVVWSGRCSGSCSGVLDQRAALALRRAVPAARLGRRDVHRRPAAGERRDDGPRHRRRTALHRRRDRLRAEEAEPVAGRFGFHEIFHVCTVLAFLCHWTACLLISLAPLQPSLGFPAESDRLAEVRPSGRPLRAVAVRRRLLGVELGTSSR